MAGETGGSSRGGDPNSALGRGIAARTAERHAIVPFRVHGLRFVCSLLVHRNHRIVGHPYPLLLLLNRNGQLIFPLNLFASEVEV